MARAIHPSRTAGATSGCERCQMLGFRASPLIAAAFKRRSRHASDAVILNRLRLLWARTDLKLIAKPAALPAREGEATVP